MFLSQSTYISKVLARAKIMVDANSTVTPMVSSSIPLAHQGELFSYSYLYRSIVGALQYVTLTRPEISYSVNKTCQFMHFPKVIHWQLVKHILRYLKGTINKGLLHHKPCNLSLVGFANAN